MIHLVKNSPRSHVSPPSETMSSANDIIKISHSTVEDRSVKMGPRNISILMFLCSLVTLINGYDLGRGRLEDGSPTPEDCSRPPMSKFGHECCRLPKERIWGDLRPSLNLCFKSLKHESGATRQEEADEGREMGTPGGTMVTPTGDPGESASTPNASPQSTTERRRRKPHGRKPYHLRRRANDSCFMECVFENQGFLVEKVINKSALLERLSRTLGQNEPWHKVASEAVETCSQQEVPSNNTCNSGSEEMFRCVLKQIFFNCPNWTQSKYNHHKSNVSVPSSGKDDYCTSLREFYQKCPNGPPPEIDDNHSTSAPPLEEDIETSPPTETERYTQSE